MEWAEIVRAVALVLIIEGIVPFLFPNRWCQLVEKLACTSPASMRISGAVSMVIGAMVLFFSGA